MNKVWLKQYPEGIPADVDIDEYASLKEIVEHSCKRFGELPAYGNMGVSITYRELDRASREFGAYLQKVLGHAERRPGRDHAAEPPAVSGGAVRHAAGRHDGGQRQPDVHGARAASTS